MLEKLKGIKERYEQLTALLSDPAVIGDQNRYRELSKEQAGLTDIVNAYDEYMAADAEIESCKAMLEEADDAAMREMIHEELSGLSAKEHELSEQLKVMLLRAARKRRCSGRIYCACTPATPSGTATRPSL